MSNTNFVYGNYFAANNGSFPIDCETFDNIQNNQALLTVLAQIAGDDKLIITGCEAESDTTAISSGYVYMKTTRFPEGEILYVEGGFIPGTSTYVSINSTDEDVEIGVSTATYEGAYSARTLVNASSGVDACLWSEFVRIETNTSLNERCQELESTVATLKPLDYGIPLMWAGAISKIPEEYALCDGDAKFLIPADETEDYWELYQMIGTLHTPDSDVADGYFRLPDLSGKFIAGYASGVDDYGTIGKTGGEDTTTKILNHTHSYAADDVIYNSDINIASRPFRFMSKQVVTPDLVINEDGQSGYHSDCVSTNDGSYETLGFYPTSAPLKMTTDEDGNYATIERGQFQVNTALENRPSYYTLAYIMRIKDPVV